MWIRRNFRRRGLDLPDWRLIVLAGMTLAVALYWGETLMAIATMLGEYLHSLLDSAGHPGQPEG